MCYAFEITKTHICNAFRYTLVHIHKNYPITNPNTNTYMQQQYRVNIYNIYIREHMGKIIMCVNNEVDLGFDGLADLIK